MSASGIPTPDAGPAPRAVSEAGLRGVALGWRRELAADLLRDTSAVDFLEVVADACFADPAAWREARAIAELRPVVPHGVKVSLGSADGLDVRRARMLAALARDLRAPAVTEHVALSRAGDVEIGHLTPLPFSRAAVSVVARNVAALRRMLPDVPLYLENAAWAFRWPEDEMREGDFYAEVAAATGCDLLLDVANLFANASNSGVPPSQALREFPLESVAMLHVAGGALEHGFYYDTHAHPVPEPVFGLVEELLGRTGALPIVLERDQGFPPFAELRAEVERLRALLAGAPPSRLREPRPPAVPPPDAGDAAELGRHQLELAVALTATGPPGAGASARYGAAGLARARGVLVRKRADEGLALLPNLASLGEPARALALDAVGGAARAPRAAGLCDAWRIAAAAVGAEGLEAAARRDRLLLRSRYERWDGRGCRPRRGPFLGRERLPDGRSLWAWKGPGRRAAVRVFETEERG